MCLWTVGGSWENPRRHRKDIQTPHRKAPGPCGGFEPGTFEPWHEATVLCIHLSPENPATFTCLCSGERWEGCLVALLVPARDPLVIQAAWQLLHTWTDTMGCVDLRPGKTPSALAASSSKRRSPGCLCLSFSPFDVIGKSSPFFRSAF